MIPDEGWAALNDMAREDIPRVFSVMGQRCGEGTISEEFFNWKGTAAAEQGDEEDELPLMLGAFIKSVGPPPPMLIPGLIPIQSIVLLTGKPKFGKTLLAIDLAESVATGRHVFGSFPVTAPGPVVYLGMEDGKYEIANRFLKRGAHEDDEREVFIGTKRFTVSTPEGMVKLHQYHDHVKTLTGKDPALFIIDTARESLGIREWNDPAEVGDKIRPLREGFARKKCSVLLIGHNRKQDADSAGDEVAGSNAFLSSVDGLISDKRVDEMPNKNRRHYLHVVGRAEMQGNFVIEMDTNNLFFRTIEEEELKAEASEQMKARRMQKHERVLEAIQNRGGKASAAQISEYLGGGERLGQKAVQAAEEDGAITIVDTLKTGRAGRPTPMYARASGINELPHTSYRDRYGNSLIPSSQNQPVKTDSLGPFGSIDDYPEADDETRI